MYCENETCRRIGLSKAEVEKDHKSGRILCLGCYKLANPDWSPTPQTEMIPAAPVLPMTGFGYAVSLDSMRGFSAQVSYGEVSLELVVPHRTLKTFMGAR